MPRQLSGFESTDISQEYKMSDISKGQKNTKKKYFYLNDMIDGLLRAVHVQPDYLAVQSVGFVHLKRIIVNLLNTYS